MARLHGLSDRSLGTELLDIARVARIDRPDCSDPADTNASADCVILWQVVPEIARRLGAGPPTPDEAAVEYLPLSNMEFRAGVTWVIANRSFRYSIDHEVDTPSAAELLARRIIDGNPLAIGLDRVAPVPIEEADTADYIARKIFALSVSLGLPPRTTWSPELVPEPPRK